MAVTQVAYEVEGWGVGELWLDGGARRLARAAVSARDAPRTRAGGELVERLQAYFDGDAGLVRRRRRRPRVRDAVPRALRAARCGRSRAARSSPTASWPRSRVRPARRGRPDRSAPATGSASSCRATASSSAGGLGSYGSLRPRVQAAPAGARGCHSLRTCATSSPQIAPESDCDRLAELSGLFHVAGSVHLRGRGEVALHLDLASSAVARRAFALLRAFDVDSEIRTYQQHAFDRATRYQLHVEGSAARVRDAAPRRRARRLAPAARAAAAARARAPLLPRRLSPRRAARRRLAERPARPAPRDPHRRARGRALPRRPSRRARGRSCTCSTAAATPSRTRRESSRSPTRSSPPARPTPCSCSRRARCSRRSAPTRTGSRTPTTRISSARAAPRTRSSRRCASSTSTRLPDDLRELASLRLRHPTASIAELARRCRPPLTKASAYRRLRRLVELAE